MLLRWLAENQSAAGISGQFVFQNGELINNLRRHKPPVLFIWTDGLRRARPSLLDKAYGTPEDAGESQPAVTSGLGKLVCWCLNEPWQSINRAASTAHDAPGV